MRVGECGKIITCATSYDMSGSTELTLVFTKPDKTTLTVTTSNGVSAPGQALGSLSASTYFSYTTAAGDIDIKGTWTVQGTYNDASPKTFISDIATFTVDP
jgi:hypothetical protein